MHVQNLDRIKKQRNAALWALFILALFTIALWVVLARHLRNSEAGNQLMIDNIERGVSPIDDLELGDARAKSSRD